MPALFDVVGHIWSLGQEPVDFADRCSFPQAEGDAPAEEGELNRPRVSPWPHMFTNGPRRCLVSLSAHKGVSLGSQTRGQKEGPN